MGALWQKGARTGAEGKARAALVIHKTQRTRSGTIHGAHGVHGHAVHVFRLLVRHDLSPGEGRGEGSWPSVHAQQ